ncbi:MAG: acyloxyacyl hydrolase, partial [Muribaculaceae bacterium]|nr:acyloxyacyl hydrolase [Muribaculaceae bacterium]
RGGVTRMFGKQTPNASNSAGYDTDTIKTRRKMQFDITAYGAWRKRVYRGGETPVLLKGHYPVVGLDISPMWQIKKIFRAGGSLDFQWDESTDLKRHHAYGDTSDDIRFYRPPILSQICVGVSGRAELVMPVFSVNVGIGYNFIGPEETRASYQLANLKVRFTERFFLNIGYQLLNFQKQNNLMLGLGYSF